MIFVESLMVFVIIAILWMLIILVIFKKLNKSRVKGVILIFLAFIGVAAVMFALGQYIEEHETNEFCGEFCHAMESHYSSYTQPKNNTYMETHFNSNVTCAQCHSGPGLIGQVESYFGVPNEMWGEYIAGYDVKDMGGHVPSENCLKGCHEEAEVDWKFEAPKPKGEGFSEVEGEVVWQRMEIYHPLTENGTNFKELEDLETCQDCHDPRDNGFGFAAEACPICHDIDEEELEHHGESTCDMATCHRDESGVPVQPKLIGHGVVKDHCMECHDRDHPEDAFVPYIITNSQGKTLEVNQSFCSACHHEAYEVLSNDNSMHYTESLCIECHNEHKNRLDCIECHNQGSGIIPNHIIDPPLDDCVSCHESAHAPLNISFLDVPTLENDFCANVSCHGGLEGEVIVFENYGLKHREDYSECTSCHEIHEKEDFDCLSCHGQDGIAPLPSHNIQNQYENCLGCHKSAHAPLNVTFRVPNMSRDFCSDVSCHGGTDEFSQFENYGGKHEELYGNCTVCHTIHISYDIELRVSKLCLDCHSLSTLIDHDQSYTNEDCLVCHNSPHDPANRALQPGYNLTQRDYMTSYFIIDSTNMTDFFNWVKRGNHIQYDDCMECHASAQESIYPTSAQNLMNVSGTDCSVSCHSWIDTTSTGKPYDLLTYSPNLFPGHTDEIFNNASGGGCAGRCHQSDPDNPILSGLGHGIITNCLDSKCHGPGFYGIGPLHVEHGNMLSNSSLSCFDVCHKSTTSDKGEPINGGCYDCHKSGHDPKIMDVSPCITCHNINRGG